MKTSATLGLTALWGQSAEACRLALVLALDVSSSVDAREDALQRDGLARALLAPQVQAAFFASPDPVALAIFEWSGRYNQSILQDWVLIETPASLASVSESITITPRSHDDYPTALGYSLVFAGTLLRRAPDCSLHTIDVSGDGLNNEGFEPRKAYNAFPFEDITVNGLVINVPETSAAREEPEELLKYYETEVIRGPSAFVVVANGFEDFARAMEVKLIRELGALILGENVVPLERGSGG
ncbi:DUF1194 domain-containing protein [Octadecabacter ascidiaceicola]|uniref:DUF1194 domain-containing protein n=1 Tax=Octadecabacter ascidiaceicola TaxID=1655543 RepID=UPI0015C62E35